jgi:hypothetical protein
VQIVQPDPELAQFSRNVSTCCREIGSAIGKLPVGVGTLWSGVAMVRSGPHRRTGQPQPLERLRAGHLVHQMQVDVQFVPVNRLPVDLRLTTRCLHCGGQCDVDPQVIPGDVTRVELRGNRPIAWGNLQNENSLAAPTASNNHATASSLDTFYLQRFERLVTHDPQSGQNQVKRLWGLPGELIEFRDGDLWINDRLYQKSIEELAQVGVPVAEYRSPNRLGSELASHLDPQPHPIVTGVMIGKV